VPQPSLRRGFERALEWIVIALMVALAVEVTAGVVFRYTGHALVWYDEVASILLAWVTYYGAALGALKRAHIGVPELVRLLPFKLRVPVALFAEGCVIAFFVLLGWIGYRVLEVLAGDSLVTLPDVSVAWPQSVIPVSSALFVVAELVVLPHVLREARAP
jgi:TRAP-type C4-dicarboxylate transport system permease small subunit